MFTVDYEVGGAAQAHDHPFEETYFFLAGEVEAEFDGETRRLRAGDVAFAAVGVSHAFYNDGPGAGPLDRDAGAPAAGPTRLPLGSDLGEVRPDDRSLSRRPPRRRQAGMAARRRPAIRNAPVDSVLP